jgi:hypothetical protein
MELKRLTDEEKLREVLTEFVNADCSTCEHSYSNCGYSGEGECKLQTKLLDQAISIIQPLIDEDKKNVVREIMKWIDEHTTGMFIPIKKGAGSTDIPADYMMCLFKDIELEALKQKWLGGK